MLTCAVRRSDESVTVRLDGELWDPRDMETLSSIVQPHLRQHAGEVRVDLSGVRHLGLIGLGALLALKAQAEASYVAFTLSGGNHHVQEQLAKVGLRPD